MKIDVDQFIGRRMRALRQARHITQQELAHRAGLAVQTISRLENARIGLSVANLADICRALGVTLAEFFDGAPVEPEALSSEIQRVIGHMQSMTPAERVAVLRTVEAIKQATTRREP